MKKLRMIVTILFLSLILVGMTSCEISRRANNERHSGWFYRHNDHHRNKGAVIIITPENRNDRELKNDHY